MIELYLVGVVLLTALTFREAGPTNLWQTLVYVILMFGWPVVIGNALATLLWEKLNPK